MIERSVIERSVIERSVIERSVIERQRPGSLRRAWRHVSLVIGLCLASVACGSSFAESSVAQSPSLGAPLSYSFLDFDGREVSSDTMQGRATLVVLVTTYDWASQLVLRRVNQTLGSFVPRINAFGVVLEPASYAVLVPQFQKSLELRFPVVMADVGSLDGRGPFAPIDYVPTVLVLDELGRVHARLKGPVTVDEVTRALRATLGLAAPEGTDNTDPNDGG